MIERGLSDVEAASAGTSAHNGAPASDGSLLVGLERNMDLSVHRAQLRTAELVQNADLILAMEPHHLVRIESLGGADNAYLLSDYASRGKSKRAISDLSARFDVYRATADELEADSPSSIEPPRSAAPARSDAATDGWSCSGTLSVTRSLAHSRRGPRAGIPGSTSALDVVPLFDETLAAAPPSAAETSCRTGRDVRACDTLTPSPGHVGAVNVF